MEIGPFLDHHCHLLASVPIPPDLLERAGHDPEDRAAFIALSAKRLGHATVVPAGGYWGLARDRVPADLVTLCGTLAYRLFRE